MRLHQRHEQAISHQPPNQSVDNPIPRVLVIEGPTASGKTALAHRLAEELPLEIISADSRQIYRGLDIGTAKPTPAERTKYHYQGIDLCYPDQQMSAGTFAHLAWKWIQAIVSRGNAPLIVGGSGLYVRAILEGFVSEPNTIPAELRARLIERLHTEGRDALYAELQELDPALAARYADRNPRRILRALEFYYGHGLPLSQAQRTFHHAPPPMEVLRIRLFPERERLYRRINERTHAMWQSGLVEETRSLLEAGYAPSLPVLTTIGYAEAIAVLHGKLPLEHAIERTAQRTRHYAKRQYTWLRHAGMHAPSGIIDLQMFGDEPSIIISTITNFLCQER
ncbi:MAG: tRNA dimethylallyltransferase [Candidatus Kapaibacterium sp.]|nr:MAG: tRNA dimethylallyltransferase [Candidatus Kapabacteria bacterium]